MLTVSPKPMRTSRSTSKDLTPVMPSTTTANLNLLSQAGLITSRREGRSILYSAHYDRMTELLGFLMQDCCAGRPEICAPLAALSTAAACCPSPTPEHLS